MRWLILLSILWTAAGTAQTVQRLSRTGPGLVTGRLSVPAPIGDVVSALQSPCAIRQWLAGLDQLQTLGHPAPGQTRVYIRLALPWPWQSRDVVSRFNRREGPTGNRIDIDEISVPGAPPPAGVVRIPWLRAHWSLSRQRGMTRIVYRQRIRLGGRMPQWMIDRKSVSVVRDSLQGLRDYLARPPQQQCLPGKPERGE